MSHWHIPTTLEVVDEGGTLFVNACGHPTLAPRNHTEDPKKATCKMCKDSFKTPRSRDTMVARLWFQVQRAKDADLAVSVRCNACDHELDVYDTESMHLFQTLRRVEDFLEHCTYHHVGGSEPMIYVEDPFLSVYESNRAMGKLPETVHEERWRERNALGADQESVDA